MKADTPSSVDQSPSAVVGGTGRGRGKGTTTRKRKPKNPKTPPVVNTQQQQPQLAPQPQQPQNVQQQQLQQQQQQQQHMQQQHMQQQQMQPNQMGQMPMNMPVIKLFSLIVKFLDLVYEGIEASLLKQHDGRKIRKL